MPALATLSRHLPSAQWDQAPYWILLIQKDGSQELPAHAFGNNALTSYTRTNWWASVVTNSCKHSPSHHCCIHLIASCCPSECTRCLLIEHRKDVVHQESFSKYIPIAQLITLRLWHEEPVSTFCSKSIFSKASIFSVLLSLAVLVLPTQQIWHWSLVVDKYFGLGNERGKRRRVEKRNPHNQKEHYCESEFT